MEPRKSTAARGEAHPPGGATPGGRPGAEEGTAAERSADRRRYGRLLDHLEREIEQLRIDSDKFLAGVEKRLPEGARQAIQRQLRLLRDEPLQTAADHFRFAGLEARFNAFQELFNRRLRALEEGRGAPRAVPAAAPPPRFDPAVGIVVAGRPDGQEAAQLLQAVVAQGAAGANLDLDRFSSYLAQQAEAIRAKTGCAAVQFRLAAEEGGRVKLKARPLNELPEGG